MQVDIIGTDDVLKYIEATKLSKFTVQRSNGSGYIPCFECIDSESNSNAINEFRKWSELIKNNIAYKLSCFDVAEVITDANGNEKIKKSNKRSGKMECTFVLNTNGANFGSTKNDHNEMQSFDMNDFKKQVIREIAEKNEQNEILNEIRSLKQKFAELEEEEEEEEKPGSSIAGIPSEQITQILGLVNMFRGNQQPPVINGVDEVADFSELDIKKQNINKAINILYKYDKNLDTDLLKLSNLAETKTDTFNMLINTLRSM
jgi:hypothetical protein